MIICTDDDKCDLCGAKNSTFGWCTNPFCIRAGGKK